MSFDDQHPASASSESFTERELQILRLLARGLSAKEVARELGIGPRLVEREVEVLRAKSGSRNTTHMVAQAVQQGWI